MTETPKDLLDEAQRGRSDRTPWIALTGVTMALGAFVGIVIVVALVVYFVA